jgi:lipoyl-dependent peroxiredoxin
MPPQSTRAIARNYNYPSHEVLVSRKVWRQNTVVKLIMKKAAVRWNGGPKCRTRIMSTQSGELARTRIYAGLPRCESSGTDPLELIAAAQAGSFSLALSNELGSAASASDHIITTATVTLERLPAGWTIMSIHLDVTAKLPKVTQGRFIDATVRAKTRCLVTRLLRTNVSMTAKLEK